MTDTDTVQTPDRATRPEVVVANKPKRRVKPTRNQLRLRRQAVRRINAQTDRVTVVTWDSPLSARIGTYAIPSPDPETGRQPDAVLLRVRRINASNGTLTSPVDGILSFWDAQGGVLIADTACPHGGAADLLEQVANRTEKRRAGFTKVGRGGFALLPAGTVIADRHVDAALKALYGVSSQMPQRDQQVAA